MGFCRILSLICLVSALAPTPLVASAAHHASSPVHTHDHGSVPHRHHDGDGEPIPVSAQPGFWAVRPSIDAGVQIPTPLPIPLLTLPARPQSGITPVTALDWADRRSRSPTVPRLGDILPLLI